MLDAKFSSTSTLRLAQLHSLDIFYTPVEARFDRLTRILRQLLTVPVAGIALAHKETLWFKSLSGWDIAELPLKQTFARATLAQPDLMIIEDTLKAPQFAELNIVRGRPGFRFYAGATLFDARSRPIGVLEVYDVQPRSLSRSQLQRIQDVAALAQKEVLTTELRDAQAELIGKLDVARRQASIDEVTRVWNRRAGLDVIRSMLVAAANTNESVTVCAVDIDRFKQVNDKLGHEMGDKVLRHITNRIVGALRGEDIICRYGGDEFLLGIRGLPRDAAEQLVSRVCKAVNSSPIVTRKGRFKASVSIGVEYRGTLVSADESELKTLIESADMALYKAKARGRNAFVMAQNESRHSAAGQLAKSAAFGSRVD